MSVNPSSAGTHASGSNMSVRRSRQAYLDKRALRRRTLRQSMQHRQVLRMSPRCRRACERILRRPTSIGSVGIASPGPVAPIWISLLLPVANVAEGSTDRGRERLSPSPPSEPGVQFSRDGLSSQLLPHRDWRANRLASDIVKSPRSAKNGLPPIFQTPR